MSRQCLHTASSPPPPPPPDGGLLAEGPTGDSPEGLVLGADVESDGPAPDVEGVDAVVFHHHLCVLLCAQLHKGLRRDGAVEVHHLLTNPSRNYI